jgi:hypothetical protein
MVIRLKHSCHFMTQAKVELGILTMMANGGLS